MRTYWFWDVDSDCLIDDTFKGTEKEARKKAIQYAKKYRVIVNVEEAITGRDIATVDEYGNDVYL